MVVLGDVSCPMWWLQCHCDGLGGLCEMGFWSWDVAQDLLGLLFVFFWLKEWIISAASPQPPVRLSEAGGEGSAGICSCADGTAMSDVFP